MALNPPSALASTPLLSLWPRHGLVARLLPQDLEQLVDLPLLRHLGKEACTAHIHPAALATPSAVCPVRRRTSAACTKPLAACPCMSRSTCSPTESSSRTARCIGVSPLTSC
eukprot:CAMPEP_0181241806 /NCGR_PEP_ID=MMETSP1096-20121128/41328_1 /TAXON_ID=156174 ORGANISM="Chrysochromulina ericina, Strain CCMP281" /NCGR_SAMPLE_ID=MMETSP1096 /ASSEMBLY_ACC=CAM_ASM_000453 /LENGTH=111 /DNA_ID=CAMNT_0023337923 /DNA_START=171 /DNA_END=503 /DNA_ORIENTATION=+